MRDAQDLPIGSSNIRLPDWIEDVIKQDGSGRPSAKCISAVNNYFEELSAIGSPPPCAAQFSNDVLTLTWPIYNGVLIEVGFDAHGVLTHSETWI